MLTSLERARRNRVASAVAFGVPPTLAFLVLLGRLLDHPKMWTIIQAIVYEGAVLMGPCALLSVLNAQVLMLCTPLGWVCVGTWILVLGGTRVGDLHWMLHGASSAIWTGIGATILLRSPQFAW